MSKTMRMTVISVCAVLMSSEAMAETVLQQLRKEAGPDAAAASAVFEPVAYEVIAVPQGSSFRRSGGDRGEFTPNGSLIRWVSHDECRRFQGRSGGICGEYTPNGSLIRWVSRDQCRMAQGSSFRWNGGNCGEYTPYGGLIRWVSRDECRRSQGSSNRWSGGNCGEYTPNGSLIRWVSRDSCRR